MNCYRRLLVLLVLCGLALPATAQQRNGGGRGAAGQGAAPQNNSNVDNTLWLSGRTLNHVFATNAAWWTNTTLVTRLGITEDQKARIERTFENHRVKLETVKATLEKEEAQLDQLLNAEPFDRNAALTQGFRVIQARSEMERENTLMTLEIREHLTRVQWTQLPQPGIGLSYFVNGANRKVRLFDVPVDGGRGGARGQQ